jgi:hypothetical protein
MADPGTTSDESPWWEQVWVMLGLPLLILGIAVGLVLAPFVSGLRIGLFGPKLWKPSSSEIADAES